MVGGKGHRKREQDLVCSLIIIIISKTAAAAKNIAQSSFGQRSAEKEERTAMQKHRSQRRIAHDELSFSSFNWRGSIGRTAHSSDIEPDIPITLFSCWKMAPPSESHLPVAHTHHYPSQPFSLSLQHGRVTWRKDKRSKLDLSLTY